MSKGKINGSSSRPGSSWDFQICEKCCALRVLKRANQKLAPRTPPFSPNVTWGRSNRRQKFRKTQVRTLIELFGFYFDIEFFKKRERLRKDAEKKVGICHMLHAP